MARKPQPSKTPNLDRASYFVVGAQDRAKTWRTYEHVIRAADPVEWEDKLALYRSQIPENIQLEVIGSFQAPGFHGTYLEDVERYLYERSEREAGRPRTTAARRRNPDGRSRRPRFWLGSAAVPARGGWIQPSSLQEFDDAVSAFDRRFGEVIVADSENVRGLHSESPSDAREWLAMFFELPDDFHDDPEFVGAFIRFAMDHRIPIDDALSLYIGPASDYAELGELLIEHEGKTELPVETLRLYFDSEAWARDRVLNAEVYSKDGLAFYRP